MNTSEKSIIQSRFSSPFYRAYWRFAVSELKSTKMLAVAAMIVALRVAVKSLVIPVGENLHISLDFFVNSVGSMIYGPIMALLVGAISDTIGAVLFPTGAYFFPFIFVEMLGSFIFGLFLYRAKLGAWRVILSRLAVTVGCNILLNPFIMIFYYRLLYGKDYTFFRLSRAMKSILLFPAESLLLVLFLTAISAATDRIGLTHAEMIKKKFSLWQIVFVVCTAAVSAAAIICYYIFFVTKK